MLMRLNASGPLANADKKLNDDGAGKVATPLEPEDGAESDADAAAAAVAAEGGALPELSPEKDDDIIRGRRNVLLLGDPANAAETSATAAEEDEEAEAPPVLGWKLRRREDISRIEVETALLPLPLPLLEVTRSSS